MRVAAIWVASARISTMLRFHFALIEPDVRFSRSRVSDQIAAPSACDYCLMETPNSRSCLGST